MNIVKQYLTVSNYNRPGTKRGSTTAVACHYIGNPGTSAQANRNYFENLRTNHTLHHWSAGRNNPDDTGGGDKLVHQLSQRVHD